MCVCVCVYACARLSLYDCGNRYLCGLAWPRLVPELPALGPWKAGLGAPQTRVLECSGRVSRGAPAGVWSVVAEDNDMLEGPPPPGQHVCVGHLSALGLQRNWPFYFWVTIQMGSADLNY